MNARKPSCCLLHAIDPNVGHLIVETEISRNRRTLAGGITIIPNQVLVHLAIDVGAPVIGAPLVWT